jgi:hypothetical protein
MAVLTIETGRCSLRPGSLDPDLAGIRSKRGTMPGTNFRMTSHLSWSLAVIGMLAGYSFGYRAAVRDAHAREYLLRSSGHGYLDYAPLIVRVRAAAVALGVVGAVVGAFFGRERRAGLRGSARSGSISIRAEAGLALVAPLLLVGAAAPADAR